MSLSDQEQTDIKAMLLFLIEKKAEVSGGHCGFHLNELNPFLQELEEEGKIKSRDTIHAKRYFLKNG
ncbi:hypothetical protein [Christiangramia sp.]|uniref:hypothetical protein n=1 Tax=Christiangramia sp. TaxID=1931228 RepID=UPI0026229E77|nr:hypothetical protein [Christiangramia sp.]